MIAIINIHSHIHKIIMVLFPIIVTGCTLFNNDSLDSELIGEWKLTAQVSGAEQVSIDSIDLPSRKIRFNGAGGFQDFRDDKLYDTGRYSIFERRDSKLLRIKTEKNKDSNEFRFEFLPNNRLKLTLICPNCLVIPQIYKKVR